MPETERVTDDWAETLMTRGVAAKSGDEWYSALRHLQGDLRAYLTLGVAPTVEMDWAKNSLFCEWGYLVNFDERTLEVYRGFQTRKHSNGRFADFDDEPPIPARPASLLPRGPRGHDSSSIRRRGDGWIGGAP